MPETIISQPIGPRHGRPSILPLRLLEGAILAVEVVLIFLIGASIAAITLPRHLPAPAAISLSYLLLVIAGGAHAKPPDRRQRDKPIQILAAVFLVAGLLSANCLRISPWLCLWFASSAAAIRLWRRLAIRLSLELPPRIWPSRPAAFIGNSEAAARLLQRINGDPRRRLHPVGFFDDRGTRSGPLHDKLPYLGTIYELVSYIQDNDLRDVFMALPWSAGERIASLIEQLRFLPLTVHLIPDQALPAVGRRHEHEQEGIIMPTLMLPPFSSAGAAAKRALDLLAAIILLLALAPLFGLVALAIMADSKGPVFFRQRRIGQFGHSFSIFKFRSLNVAQSDAAAETLVAHGDARVTRVGKYLRKYSIDELPQIINVLLGDMSLVGPRPHAPRAKAGHRIFAEVMPDYMLRYRVKPGMTGWAQVNGWRGNTDTEEKLKKRVEFDFAYIKTWSLLKDLQILLLTVPSALFPPVDNA